MLLLITVIQPTKNKVRLVVDIYELNEHVSCHMCGEASDVYAKIVRVS